MDKGVLKPYGTFGDIFRLEDGELAYIFNHKKPQPIP
jgi:hypothetical protein